MRHLAARQLVGLLFQRRNALTLRLPRVVFGWFFRDNFVCQFIGHKISFLAKPP
jgi:hypothetical protein